MKMNRLGSTDVLVSELCLGTMTFGTQTPEPDAHRQIDMALDRGINIADTAELYPVNPMTAATQGDSERVLGNWIASSGRRKDLLVATKISGEGQKMIRDGAPISRGTIAIAVESSLKRLKTDYIDIYQLHWPNRGSYMFRQNWTFDPTKQNSSDTLGNMAETLEAIDELVKAGKIRFFGLSNESAWGTANWLRIAREQGLPKVESIQNEYSLMCRLYDTDLAELSHHEFVGLLAYSPLATGLLTGKYRNGAVPAGSRKSILPALGGRSTERSSKAVEAYLGVARKHGLDLAHMSLAFCTARPFMASAIFGATTSGQLEHLLKAADVTLPEECLDDIDKAHRSNPMPY